MQFISRFFFLALFSLIYLGCTKKNTLVQVDKPGVALTFDDNYVDEWNEVLPLLDSITYYLID